MIIGGSAYYELFHDNYRPRGGKWVKMSKEEVKEYDNDPNINMIFALVMDDSSDNNYYPDDMNWSKKKTSMQSSHSRTSFGISNQIDRIVVLDISKPITICIFILVI